MCTLFVDLCTLLWYTNSCLLFEIRGIDMDERNFRLWMETTKNYHTARTYTARCIRVETEMNINLDEQYDLDKGDRLMQTLKYSRKEAREGKQRTGISLRLQKTLHDMTRQIRTQKLKCYFNQEVHR